MTRHPTQPPTQAIDGLAELIARAEIGDVIHAYCRFADAADTAGMASCFTEDGVMDLWAGQGERAIVGSAAIEARLAAALGKIRVGSHFIANATYHFTAPDAADVLVYMQSMQRFYPETGLPELQRFGRYELAMRRAGDGWRIARMTMFAVTEIGSDREDEYAGRPWPPPE